MRSQIIKVSGMEDEVEVLEAIFPDELTVTRDKDFIQLCLSLTPDDLPINLKFKEVSLLIVLGISNKSLEVSISSTRGLAADEHICLLNTVTDISDEIKSTKELLSDDEEFYYSICEIAETVRSTISTMNTIQCSICLETSTLNNFSEVEKFCFTPCEHAYHWNCILRYDDLISNQSKTNCIENQAQSMITRQNELRKMYISAESMFKYTSTSLYNLQVETTKFETLLAKLVGKLANEILLSDDEVIEMEDLEVKIKKAKKDVKILKLRELKENKHLQSTKSQYDTFSLQVDKKVNQYELFCPVCRSIIPKPLIDTGKKYIIRINKMKQKIGKKSSSESLSSSNYHERMNTSLTFSDKQNILQTELGPELYSQLLKQQKKFQRLLKNQYAIGGIIVGNSNGTNLQEPPFINHPSNHNNNNNNNHITNTATTISTSSSTCNLEPVIKTLKGGEEKICDTSKSSKKHKRKKHKKRAKNIKELEKSMKQEKEEKRLAEIERIVERRKRKAEAQLKHTSYQTINDPNKIKKMSKKQLKHVKKTRVNKDGSVSLVNAYA